MRGRELLVAAMACLLFAVGLATGCGGGGGGGANDRALKARLAAANAHLTKSAGYIKELEGFKKSWTDALASGLTPDNIAKLKELLAGARRSEAAALGEVKEAAADLTSAKSLKMSASTSTYIDMKLDAVEEQEKALTAELEAMDLRIQTADAIAAGAPLDQQTILRERRISELEEESKEHNENSASLNKKANDYYEKKKLGK